MALLSLTAVASRGGRPAARAGDGSPSEWALDIAASLVLVLLVPGALLLVFVVLLRPTALQSAGRRERRAGSIPSLAAVGIALVLLVLAVRRLSGGEKPVADPGAGPGGVPGAAGGEGDRGYEPSFAVVPVVVVVVLAAVALGAALLARRAHRSVASEAEAELGTAVADALDESLDDLRADPDARRAVIAAYARLERVLAAFALARRPAEAPEEYLRRILPALEVSAGAVTRLTALFETAKFSEHDVVERMRDEAISGLQAARDELLLAEARRQEARRRALALAGSPR